MKRPYFLNVDLDIESKSPLRALAREFGDRVSVTFSGRMRGYHCLYLEIASAERSQDRIIKALCGLIEELSTAGKRLWTAAHKREFDLGYEMRLSSEQANRFTIRPNTLRRVVGLGASVAVTLYREENRTGQKQQTLR
jgi:hypothetical protein